MYKLYVTIIASVAFGIVIHHALFQNMWLSKPIEQRAAAHHARSTLDAEGRFKLYGVIESVDPLTRTFVLDIRTSGGKEARAKLVVQKDAPIEIRTSHQDHRLVVQKTTLREATIADVTEGASIIARVGADLNGLYVLGMTISDTAPL